jgi:hypothetical protein
MDFAVLNQGVYRTDLCKLHKKDLIILHDSVYIMIIK